MMNGRDDSFIIHPSAFIICLKHEQADLQPFASEAVEERALLVFAGALDDDLDDVGWVVCFWWAWALAG